MTENPLPTMAFEQGDSERSLKEGLNKSLSNGVASQYF